MKEKLEQRLAEVERKIDWLEMADRMRPAERAEWYALTHERAQLTIKLAQL